MGYVYILTNKSFRYGFFRRELIKIGKTNRHPDERARELSGTGVPTPFEVAYYLPSDLSDELEREMHRELDAYRSNKDREFFKYPVKKAIQLLKLLNSKLSRSGQQPIQFERSAVKPSLGVNRFRGDPRDNSRSDYQVKLGINGKPYYSRENGFQEAVNANGITASIRPHVTIIIDNEELEIRTAQEHFESKIDDLCDEIDQLETKGRDITSRLKVNQSDIVDSRQSLSELKAIDELEKKVAEKIEAYNQERVKLVELAAELKRFPPDDGTSKHRQLRLYPVFGIFCVVLSFALYFFYVSALDKGFFSSIDLESTDMTSYANLNELFDPNAFFRAFQEANLWLLLFPIFPLGLALVIHPFWASAVKHWGLSKQGFTILCVFIALLFIGLTLVFDSILALQISKKIHEAKVIMGLATGEWTINPIDPLTWDLNIVLVLFCGFFVSVLLSVLFHFTLEMWKEVRIQSLDDRDSIVKELDKLEAEMRNLDEEIKRLSETLDNGKKKMGETLPDAVFIQAQIDTLETHMRNLESAREADKKRIQSIQSEIKDKVKLIDDLEARKSKRIIDLLKLKAQLDEFLSGWNGFLAARGIDAEAVIEETRQVAYEVFNKHFSGGIR